MKTTVDFNVESVINDFNETCKKIQDEFESKHGKEEDGNEKLLTFYDTYKDMIPEELYQHVMSDPHNFDANDLHICGAALINIRRHVDLTENYNLSVGSTISYNGIIYEIKKIFMPDSEHFEIKVSTKINIYSLPMYIVEEATFKSCIFAVQPFGIIIASGENTTSEVISMLGKKVMAEMLDTMMNLNFPMPDFAPSLGEVLNQNAYDVYNDESVKGQYILHQRHSKLKAFMEMLEQFKTEDNE